MASEISLREVRESDLPIFFEQQLDPDASRMASFPARSRDEFRAHWAKSLSERTAILRTIVVNGNVAGNIIGWGAADEPKVGYWLGKEHWGKGIASEALSQFLVEVAVRPLYARVAKQNLASIRVLQKCGFEMYGEDTFTDPEGRTGTEFILVIGINHPVP